ncbi:sucrase ferredoxin [Ilumatobacter coccineus]|uniref:Sucrase ferredoxin n=1 Tax=Ilumatobacter coccineus (strain NBRC 103263 / KCTC 29153 / YM16-304) TaxID=1313172 RepID=A0A6C7EB75_ILUCY|nr:sucrase ferredoxin [Ilumatobacter coccineus]BAN03573.1 hypothetical protein YM304_32590 [Ilumatobacter coccineus YM16-304]
MTPAPSSDSGPTATSFPIDRYCADRSRSCGEPCAGTPGLDRRFLLVGAPGPWPAEAVDYAEGIQAEAVAARARLVLVRHPMLTRAHRAVVADGGIDWYERADEGALAIESPLDGPMLAVCTHARQDLCCGRYGASLVTALRPHLPATLECSHLGGDRFAPNGLMLPSGILLGRLDAVSAPDLASTIRSGSVDPRMFRGRGGQAPHDAAVEAEIRRHTGVHDLDVPVRVEWDEAEASFTGRVGDVAVSGTLSPGTRYSGRLTCSAETDGYRHAVDVTVRTSSPGRASTPAV